jgi:chloramphenicol 3-O-phosphotransferase
MSTANPDAEAIAAVVLTGAPGTGKSSALEALSTLLEIGGVEHGAIESEQLAWGWPWLPFGAAVQQLEAVLALQRRAGRHLFLVVATTENVEELRGVIDAVRADRVLVVCLAARPETVAARLAEREPDRWPGKHDLIARARTLARAIPQVEGIDVVIDTDEVNADQVAAQVRDTMTTRGLLPTDLRRERAAKRQQLRKARVADVPKT